jgi:cation:H+ antiporter
MVGLVVVSLGTDLPEISNSIVSSILGHGDINVGDSFGSVLAQISLVLGIFPFLGGRFRVRRDEVVVIGACEVLALIASVSMVEKGYISRLNGVFMVTSWPILMLIAKNAIFREARVPRTDPGVLRDLAMAILSYLGVAVGSYVVINSVITLSALLHIHEYILSFFMLAIGTSLPELAVDLTAIRKKQYEIAVGDAMGSCIVDAGFSIGVGALLSPITVSARLAETTGAYAILVSVVVIATLALREKLDRKAGALFIALYLVSYALLAMG